MKQFEFINKNLGRKVYLSPTIFRSLSSRSDLQKFIITDDKKNDYIEGQLFLNIVKVTKSGLVSLYGEDGKYYSVSIQNVRLAVETETYQRRIDKLEALAKRLPRDIHDLMWKEMHSDITRAYLVQPLEDELIRLVKP